jgi:hypothetical protein
MVGVGVNDKEMIYVCNANTCFLQLSEYAIAPATINEQ